MLRLVSDYREDDTLRRSFSRLAALVFDAAFDEWYRRGFWDDTYVCYSFAKAGDVVANVSVSDMSLVFDGRKTRAVQVGTVMTHPNFRGKGLSRHLMEHALQEHAGDNVPCFLTADAAATGYYPRFGFKSLPTWDLVMDTVPGDPRWQHGMKRVRKLDPRQPDDLELIVKTVSQREPVSRLVGVQNALAIFMWHCFNDFAGCLYYLPEYGSLAAARYQGTTLHLYDLVCPAMTVAGDALASLLQADVRRVVFHFTPDLLGADVHPVPQVTGDLFFVRGSFPDALGAFRFPASAVA